MLIVSGAHKAPQIKPGKRAGFRKVPSASYVKGAHSSEINDSITTIAVKFRRENPAMKALKGEHQNRSDWRRFFGLAIDDFRFQT